MGEDGYSARADVVGLDRAMRLVRARLSDDDAYHAAAAAVTADIVADTPTAAAKLVHALVRLVAAVALGAPHVGDMMTRDELLEHSYRSLVDASLEHEPDEPSEAA